VKEPTLQYMPNTLVRKSSCIVLLLRSNILYADKIAHLAFIYNDLYWLEELPHQAETIALYDASTSSG